MAADIFAQIVEKIIRAQENLIGPIALEQAKNVEGLQVDWSKHEIRISGNKKAVLDSLVKRYERFFGRASIEVCKEAVKSLISQVPKDQLPASLG